MQFFIAYKHYWTFKHWYWFILFVTTFRDRFHFWVKFLRDGINTLTFLFSNAHKYMGLNLWLYKYTLSKYSYLQVYLSATIIHIALLFLESFPSRIIYSVLQNVDYLVKQLVYITKQRYIILGNFASIVDENNIRYRNFFLKKQISNILHWNFDYA